MAFRGDGGALVRANLGLRTATRILLRLADFSAPGFAELERRAGRLPWERFVRPGDTAVVRASCEKSRLYHSGAVAERVAAAIDRRVPGVRFVRAGNDEAQGSQLVLVRLERDHCTVSIDTSGPLLHRRGYRLAQSQAPLRETLAAALLLAAAYNGTAPLIDPMAGAATIAIEAALIARQIPPGLGRRFRCLDWPAAPWAWERERARLEEGISPRAPWPIVASDLDAEAVAAAVANVARAAVDGDVEVRHQPLDRLSPYPGPGWLVSNPPYGVRIGARSRLPSLWRELGRLARGRVPDWTVGLIAASPELPRALGLPIRRLVASQNGGLAVRLVIAGGPK